MNGIIITLLLVELATLIWLGLAVQKIKELDHAHQELVALQKRIWRNLG